MVPARTQRDLNWIFVRWGPAHPYEGRSGANPPMGVVPRRWMCRRQYLYPPCPEGHGIIGKLGVSGRNPRLGVFPGQLPTLIFSWHEWVPWHSRVANSRLWFAIENIGVEWFPWVFLYKAFCSFYLGLSLFGYFGYLDFDWIICWAFSRHGLGVCRFLLL